MLTECSQDSLDFASLGGRKVTAAFDGGAMTSNAGALLLRETDRAISLSRQVAVCFTDGRRQDRVEHSVETLVAQRIHGIALGYEDLNDHDELRHDPVLGLVSSKAQARRSDCAVLAGKSTLNRLEHAPRTEEDRYRKLAVDEDAMKRLRANQLRLWFASLAYVLMTALRRMALQGTELAQATTRTIRLKLLKLGALVTVSVRRVKIAIASACPLKGVFVNAHRRLCSVA